MWIGKTLLKSLIVIPINSTMGVHCEKCKWHFKHIEKSPRDKIMNGLILVLQ
jgi:hypothetical protein